MSVSKQNKQRPERQWPFALSALVNLALVLILLGPWVWAYVESGKAESPGRYVERLWRSMRSREEASWRKMTAGTGESGRGKVDDAMDRVEAALKKPVLDKAEIQHALDDLKNARKEVQQGVANVVNPPEQNKAQAPAQ